MDKNSSNLSSPTRFMKGRKAPPSHFFFKIKPFSLLSKYTSEEFESGGYNWDLSIEKDGEDHISIYLNLNVLDSTLFPIGWEVNAIVNFFVYDFLLDEYVTSQDGIVRRFHVLQTKWGISKFIDLATFNDPSNGYLFDDSCVFGAEVFIVKPSFEGKYLSLIDKPQTLSYTWKFENFSNSSSEEYESEIFVAQKYKWKLELFPNGNGDGKGNSISLFLRLVVSSLLPNTKLYVHYLLRAIDQISGQHIEHEYYNHFSNSSSSWGSSQFMSLDELNDPANGFLVGNCCLFEAKVQVLGLVKPIKK